MCLLHSGFNTDLEIQTPLKKNEFRWHGCYASQLKQFGKYFCYSDVQIFMLLTSCIHPRWSERNLLLVFVSECALSELQIVNITLWHCQVI